MNVKSDEERLDHFLQLRVRAATKAGLERLVSQDARWRSVGSFVRQAVERRLEDVMGTPEGD